MERNAGLDGLRRAKVIMTSASQEQQDIAGAFRSKCDAYLFKPIEKRALMSKLSHLGLTA
jgi:CheY-like chemotaxis protein